MVIEKYCQTCNNKLNLREKRLYTSNCQRCVNKKREQKEWDNLWAKDVKY